VTATHGGLRINTQGRVLNALGAPVPGLLAAGVDAGNVFGEGYAGFPGSRTFGARLK
jgi:predicted oxidoreductase